MKLNLVLSFCCAFTVVKASGFMSVQDCSEECDYAYDEDYECVYEGKYKNDAFFKYQDQQLEEKEERVKELELDMSDLYLKERSPYGTLNLTEAILKLLAESPTKRLLLHATNGAYLLPLFARTNFSIVPKFDLIAKHGVSPFCGESYFSPRDEEFSSWYEITEPEDLRRIRLLNEISYYVLGKETLQRKGQEDYEQALLRHLEQRWSYIFQRTRKAIDEIKDCMSDLHPHFMYALQSAMRLYQWKPSALNDYLRRQKAKFQHWFDGFELIESESEVIRHQWNMFIDVFQYGYVSWISEFNEDEKMQIQSMRNPTFTIFYSYYAGMRENEMDDESKQRLLNEKFPTLGLVYVPRKRTEVKLSDPIQLGRDIQGILTDDKALVERVLKRGGFTKKTEIIQVII